MEEKKRRPRLTKPRPPLQERRNTNDNDSENYSSQRPNRNDDYDRNRHSQRRNYDDRGPRRNYDDAPPSRHRNDNDNRYGRSENPYNDRPRRNYDNQNDRNNNRSGNYNRNSGYNRDRGGYNNRGGGYNNRRGGGGGYNNRRGGGGFNRRPPKEQIPLPPQMDKPEMPSGVEMPLNKYLARCGVASRRKSVEYIQEGKVQVNGEVQDQPFYRLQEGDVVSFEGKNISIQERMIYLLFNKPKNVITTTDDENDRTTVMDYIDPFFPERLYPAGRLDRDTTGLIVITNDGDFAELLTHPSYNIFKQYRVTLNHNFRPEDMAALERGITLEDGEAPIRWARLAEGKPHVVELEIKIGRNRIVRRIFEHLGYRVYKLDRFYIGGLTKKNLKRGSFRELTTREITNVRNYATYEVPTDSSNEESEQDQN